MKYKNTFEKGSARFIIFKEDDTWYGVALEFNIVEEGDNPEEVMASLFQAAQGYVETARKLKLRPMPLNQKPAQEYENLWNDLQERKAKKIAKPKKVFSYGYAPFSGFALTH